MKCYSVFLALAFSTVLLKPFSCANQTSPKIPEFSTDDEEERCILEQIGKGVMAKLRSGCCPCLPSAEEKRNPKKLCCECTEKNSKFRNMKGLIYTPKGSGTDDQCVVGFEPNDPKTGKNMCGQKQKSDLLSKVTDIVKKILKSES